MNPGTVSLHQPIRTYSRYLGAHVWQDFKLQGRTLPKLIISIFKRTTPPWMNLASFYVLISRCRTSDSLRLLQYDLEGLNAVCALRHDEYLVAWENAYDDKGRWSDALAMAALERVRRERQRAKAARAAEKKEKDVQRMANKRKEAAARRREAKAQVAAEKPAQAEAQKKAQVAAEKKARAEVVVPAAQRQKLSKAPMPTPVTQRTPRLDDSDLDSD